MPEIAVIVPAYNAERYIRDCVESVLAQDGVRTCVIVVNDGSTDKTVEVLARECGHETRLRVVQQPRNQGVSAARNAGRAESPRSAEFLMFLDADDMLLPGALKVLSNYMQANPAIDAAFGQAMAIGPDGAILNPLHRPDRRVYQSLGDRRRLNLGRITSIDLLDDNLATTPGQVMIRASSLRDDDLFDIKLLGPEDWDFWFRFSRGKDIVGIPELVLKYRIHGSSLSRSRWRMRRHGARMRLKWILLSNWKTRCAILRSYLIRIGDRSRLKRLLPR